MRGTPRLHCLSALIADSLHGDYEFRYDAADILSFLGSAGGRHYVSTRHAGARAGGRAILIHAAALVSQEEVLGAAMNTRA